MSEMFEEAPMSEMKLPEGDGVMNKKWVITGRDGENEVAFLIGPFDTEVEAFEWDGLPDGLAPTGGYVTMELLEPPSWDERTR